MKHALIVVSVSLITASCMPSAAQQPPPSTRSAESATANTQCSSSPCGNTPTGEDPQDIAIRKGRKARDAIVENGTDESRWALRIYSTSKPPERLDLYVIKAADFKMRLVPALGHLRFEFPTGVDEFEIEQPNGAANSICPEYNINVINASRSHAIVRKSCPLYEYRPGRYAMGMTYYLYDAPTHIMRVLWQSQTNGKDDPFPAPDAKPKVTMLNNGYTIDWTASYPSEGSIRKFSLHNRYTRNQESGSARATLQCTDTSQSGKNGVESGSCEGAMLPRVAVSKQ